MLTYVLPLLGLAVLAWISIRHRPLISSVVFLIVCLSFWYSWANLMGLPRPFVKEVDVYAYMLDEPNHIYIWSGDNPPIAYRLPWDMEKAKVLISGLPVRYMKHEGEWIFHKRPVEDLPPK